MGSEIKLTYKSHEKNKNSVGKEKILFGLGGSERDVARRLSINQCSGGNLKPKLIVQIFFRKEKDNFKGIFDLKSAQVAMEYNP